MQPEPVRPRYPIFIPSKGRHETCHTARFLLADGVDFRLVVEPHEAEAYASRFGDERVLVLPFENLGLGSIPARNWIMEHSIAEGHARHWQLDDNIRNVVRYWRGRRIVCASGPALAVVEDFADRYTNVAIAGLAYRFFASKGMPPFYVNVHVYSCTLVDNANPWRWRGRYNEDTDLCLQVLAGGKCTVLVNVFMVDKIATMLVRGGNTDELYAGDGRLEMARSLERAWPGVVRVSRRFGRPQHVIVDGWRRFDTPLELRDDVVLDELRPNEYGLKLTGTPRSKRLRQLVDEASK
jgi:hypothetical protein